MRVALLSLPLLLGFAAAQGEDATLEDAEDAVGFAEGREGRALVLLQQTLLSEVPAVGQEMTVTMSAINVGSEVAENVKVSMSEFPSHHFEVLVADNAASMEGYSLQPGESREHTFTMLPSKVLSLSSAETKAKVEYRYGTETPTEKVGYSVGIGAVSVVSAAEFARATSHNLMAWAQYAIAAGGLIVYPLTQFMGSSK